MGGMPSSKQILKFRKKHATENSLDLYLQNLKSYLTPVTWYIAYSEWSQIITFQLIAIS